MGEVVVFRSSAKDARGRVEEREDAGARVYVFTGVRYERDNDETPSSGDPSLVAPRGGGPGRGKRRKRG